MPDKHVFTFDDLPPALFDSAGGKGGTLARLRQAGYPVPEGVVILPGAFTAGTLSPAVWAQVQAWLASVPADGGQAAAFAVRSSALSEDSAQASFAGEFETVLDARGADAIAQAIHTVQRSRAAERVQAYSAAMGLAPAPEGGPGGGMAVIVQRLVRADHAGVLFTADPVSGSRASMLGNFVRGLGDQLVSGEADAEQFTLDQPHGRYGGAPALRALGRQLFRLGQRLEAELGAPQDIEWAVAGGRLWLLQARPITTLRGHDPATGEWNDSLTGEYLWTNSNYGEAVPDVMTPATWSAAQLLMSELMPPNPTTSRHAFIGNIGGRFYLNVSLMASLFKALGFSRQRLQHEMEEFYGRVPPELEIPIIPFSTLTVLSRMLPFGVRARRRLAANRKPAHAYVATGPQRTAALRAKIQAAENPAALAERWVNEVRPAFLVSAAMLQVGTSAYENTYRPLRHALQRQVGLEDTNALLSGVSANGHTLASLGPVLGLWQVAQGTLSQAEYAAVYGHRGAHELELAWPRPMEEPDWIEQQLAGLRRNPVDVPGLLAQQQARHDAAWQRYTARYPRQAAGMRRKLDAAAAAARMREATRSELTRLFGVLRAFARRAGALTGLGDDIFYLALDEMVAVLHGDTAAAAYIPARRATQARYSALPPYPSLIRGRFDPFVWAADPQRRSDVFDAQAAPREAAPGGATLTGYAGAAGVVEGTVRVLRSVEEGPALQAGEVLVAATTNIGWSPLFPRAAAVVTDVGAPLSHAAIVARELGIPAVVGCGQATMRLRTGDRVRVNGGQGTVTLLAQDA